MADAKLTALTAASALAAADLFYVSQSAASRKATGTQLLALVGTAYVPLAGGTMTGALTIASGTLTASAPALNITQTWNQSGVAFVGALWSFTKTAADASYPLLIRVDGSNIFSLDHTGFINAHSFKGNLFVGQSEDVPLVRDAAAQLALRNGTTAQRMHIYGTYTDASNLERLTLSTTAGSSVNIVAETLGTGGDNLDIVLTPAGTGSVYFPGGAYVANSGVVNAAAFVTASAGYFGGVVIGYPSSDTAFLRGAAGQVDVTNGSAATYRDLKLRNLLNTEYHQMTEMTAPSAPATNSVRIYAEDNGAGKTRLMALFATGAAQQIAIEP